MSMGKTNLGILVGVDGSTESETAVRWATHEAMMRKKPLTLMHAVVPVTVTWPVASMQGSFNEWQRRNAQEVLERAQKTVHASAGESEPPSVETKVSYENVEYDEGGRLCASNGREALGMDVHKKFKFDAGRVRDVNRFLTRLFDGLQCSTDGQKCPAGRV